MTPAPALPWPGNGRPPPEPPAQPEAAPPAEPMTVDQFVAWGMGRATALPRYELVAGRGWW